MTHWTSPNFYGYFPSACSYPSVVGELLSAGIGGIGLSWLSSPVMTELEAVTMDWLCKMLGLPEEFLNCNQGPGGGVIQVSIVFMIFYDLCGKNFQKVGSSGI